MEGFRHIVPVEIRFRDIDALGHVNNAVVFTLLETGRTRYLVDLGLFVPQAGWSSLSFILAHVNCNFRKPIFYGQSVQVGTRTIEMGRSSIRLEHRIEADGELAVDGDGIMVYYDYTSNSSQPVPPKMRSVIETFEWGDRPDKVGGVGEA